MVDETHFPQTCSEDLDVDVENLLTLGHMEVHLSYFITCYRDESSSTITTVCGVLGKSLVLARVERFWRQGAISVFYCVHFGSIGDWAKRQVLYPIHL